METEEIQQLRQQEANDHCYTRGEPIWLLHSGYKQPDKAFFVAYRTKRIVIDLLTPDGTLARKFAQIDAIRPRIEENKHDTITERG